MKHLFIIWLPGVIVYLFTSCMDTKDCSCPATGTVDFIMQDIAYIFEGNEASGYRPYYTLTDQLDILTFKTQQLDSSFNFDYNYCKEHAFIPLQLSPGSYDFLFVGNLFDHKAMHWEYTPQGKLQTTFSILESQEPPVYLTAFASANLRGTAEIPVRLRMLISRLEVNVLNPPQWVNELDFSIDRIARNIIITKEKNNKEITENDKLNDTTSVYKTVSLHYAGPGNYWTGINTFPTYENLPARVDIKLKGENKINQLVIDDSRMIFIRGQITRVNIEFESENTITVSVQIDGKWEIIDEGKIEI